MHHNAQYSLGLQPWQSKQAFYILRTSQCVGKDTEVVPHNGWCLSHIPTIPTHTSPMASAARTGESLLRAFSGHGSLQQAGSARELALRTE